MGTNVKTPSEDQVERAWERYLEATRGCDGERYPTVEAEEWEILQRALREVSASRN